MAHERVRLNAAMFYNDYSNLQVQTFVAPGVTAISNAAASTIKGAEIETAAAAWRGLQLAGHLAWLDAKYDRYDAVGPGDVHGDASGHRLNNAPAWSGSASTLYEVAPAEGWHVFARGDLQWQSRAFFTPFNTDIESQAPYGLLHLRAGLRPSSRRWEFSVYVRNVGNQEYVTGASFPNAAISCRHGAAWRSAPVGHGVHIPSVSAARRVHAATSPVCELARGAHPERARRSRSRAIEGLLDVDPRAHDGCADTADQIAGRVEPLAHRRPGQLVPVGIQLPGTRDLLRPVEEALGVEQEGDAEALVGVVADLLPRTNDRCSLRGERRAGSEQRRAAFIERRE